MPINEEQREERRKHIGSSDVPKILGKDPFGTAVDVYVAKTELIDDKPKPVMQAGTRLERSVIDWAAEQLGVELLFDQFRVSPKNEIMASNHDGLVVGKPEGVEAKTTCILHYSPEIAELWGEEGTDQVPDHVILQTHAQMYVSDLQLVWVPCLIGGRGFKMYRVDRNEDLIEAIVGESTRFWNEHVIPRIAPNGQAPSLDVMRLVRRQPNKITAISVETMGKWLLAKEGLKRAQDEADRTLAALLLELGDAEAGDSDLGRFTYLEQTRKEHFVKESTFRVPRFKGRTRY